MQNLVVTVAGSQAGMAESFLALLPRLTDCLQLAFRGFREEQREDAFHEALANAFTAFARLWERGRQHLAFPSVLARYAVVQWFAGRRVGSRLNVRDVLSPYAQKCRQFAVQRLDRYDHDECSWREAIVEDHQTPVPEQVAFRLDFPEWLGRLTPRNRRIAQQLAHGETTQAVARRFRLSEARVSQLRRELRDSWHQFRGECPVADPSSEFQLPNASLNCRHWSLPVVAALRPERRIKHYQSRPAHDGVQPPRT